MEVTHFHHENLKIGFTVSPQNRLMSGLSFGSCAACWLGLGGSLEQSSLLSGWGNPRAELPLVQDFDEIGGLPTLLIRYNSEEELLACWPAVLTDEFAAGWKFR